MLFGRQSSRQSSLSPRQSSLSSRRSPSPRVGDMLTLSANCFEDFLGIDAGSESSDHPNMEDMVTPKKSLHQSRHDTPYGKVPYGLNPFGATFFPMVPKVTQQAHQLVKKIAAPSPAMHVARHPIPEPEMKEAPSIGGDLQDGDCDSVDSVFEEARKAASKATKELPAKGWLKTSIKKHRKAFETKKKEERAAAKAAKKAETYAAKAAKATMAKDCKKHIKGTNRN